MKALSILLLASVCAGQTTCKKLLMTPGYTSTTYGGWFDTLRACKTYEKNPKPTPLAINWPHESETKPLKCGKYEHHTGNICSKTQGQPVVCGDHCAPIMHEITEKEWQALMERLKTLEPITITVTSAGTKPCVLKAGEKIPAGAVCVDGVLKLPKGAGKE